MQRVDLPGIGVRHDVLTEGGRRVSVVSHRSGERDLALYDPEDPDASSDSIALTDDEAAALADVLGATLVLGRLSGLSEQAPGLFIEHISLPANSAFADRPLSDTKARSQTGASIVAIVRGLEVIPSPTPAQVMKQGDVIVAVGTRAGLDALGRLIANGPG